MRFIENLNKGKHTEKSLELSHTQVHKNCQWGAENCGVKWCYGVISVNINSYK